MRNLLCRLFGHRWGMPKVIHARPEGCTFVETCRRCGHSETYSTFTLPTVVLSRGPDHA